MGTPAIDLNDYAWDYHIDSNGDTIIEAVTNYGSDNPDPVGVVVVLGSCPQESASEICFIHNQHLLG